MNGDGRFEPIAIIGMAALMPDAPNVETFWSNVLEGKVSIKEMDVDRWDPSDFYTDGGPGNVPEGKTYARIAAQVEGYEFDWRRHRVPPGTLTQIDLAQQWAVTVGAAALEHAGYGEDKALPRERTGVTIANALGGEFRNLSNFRVWADALKRKALERGLPEEEGDAFVASIVEGSPRIDEDTMPGELANVVAGRVANLLDLQGPNHTTDAACASSMAALLDACLQLQAGFVDVMLVGATDRTLDPATFAKFSAIGALSPTHSTPFDAGANGFVMGEGAGMFVIKRLSDAMADGDHVHAVIRGIGASSDGRGKGITAPSQRGQIQAIERAYAQAGYQVGTVGLIEAHGTSTKVGDATELASLATAFGGAPSGDLVAVGSVKSQIGHLKAAAGIAGLIKTTLALREATLPPSAGFQTPNPNVAWEDNPFYVPTSARPWPSPRGHPRRAGISAFGFGGTNWHVALEAYDPMHHKSVMDGFRSTAPARPSLTWEQMKSVEGGVLALDGGSLESLQARLADLKKRLSTLPTTFDTDPHGLRLSTVLPTWSDSILTEGPRLAISATSWAQLAKRLDLALASMMERDRWGFLAAQGIILGDGPTAASAKVAHTYPGQGSQWVGMTQALGRRFAGVGEIWERADRIMAPILGEPLSGFVLREALDDEARKDAEAKLKRTEYTQPAMLTADLAIERVLNDHGVKPDMVAGHSLGEYAALMVAGIMDMDSALKAAAARGTEMGNVDVPDAGLMASVTAPYEEVVSTIEAVDGYVIAANKNSPKMTVIAGETEAVRSAIAAFETAGHSTVILQTSHAFHSRIVAPASEPLKRYLEGIDLAFPNLPITSNFDGAWYPMEGDSPHEAIMGQLAPQMESAVEWTKQIRTMHEAGARVFVEVGPKRALTIFATQILEDDPHLALHTNHPKGGEMASMLSSLAALMVAGRPVRWPGPDDTALTEGFRARPIDAPPKASSVLEQSAVAPTERSVSVVTTPLPAPGMDTLAERVRRVLARASGYPARFCEGNVGLKSGLGLDDVAITTALNEIARIGTPRSDVDRATLTTAGDVLAWVGASGAVEPTSPTGSRADSDHARRIDPFVITGTSLGLPGVEGVFDEDNHERLVRGETCITEVSDDYKQRLLDRNIMRLIKGRDGSVSMERAERFEDVPQLAGLSIGFDPVGQFGMDEGMLRSWDLSTKLAVVSGILALRDAGIPLTPVEQTGKAGLRVIRGWQMPSAYRDRTGIVFASCFPGLNRIIEHANSGGDDGEGNFDRRYLFQALNMGHSQFAQYTGIRGPNTTLNLACASATAAFSIAEDWMTTGRCDRVIILSSDDVTSEHAWDWIGAGFAASGAAATGNLVEETALPFDRRRNGLILGMGAAAFVLERRSEAEARGVQPIAELLGTQLSNSAFHGTRLDVDHVAESVDSFVSDMESKWAFDRHAIAPNLAFYSHETYTPARGGSAQSEVKALRTTFGASADEVLITNTKGFTGHPMGVGIEDSSMMHGLLTGRFPPIANHQEHDPELGNLRLSPGGTIEGIEYGMRFGAGFGSQVALSLVRRWPVIGDRIDDARLLGWCRGQAGTDAVHLRVLHGHLVAYADPDERLHGGMEGSPWTPPAVPVRAPAAPPDPVPTPPPASEEQRVKADTKQDPPTSASTSTSPSVAVASQDEDATRRLVGIVAKQTGYPEDFIELDQDLEAELGIDTVKQAEIMAEVRTAFELPVDETFLLSDHPTLNHFLTYIAVMTGGDPPSPLVEPPAPSAPPTPTPDPVVPEDSTASKVETADPSIAGRLVEIVVEHTGYPADFIELDQDLEAELGIDTVKQAEIMADVRSAFDLPVDEGFLLSDHPTLNHFIGYIQRMLGGTGTAMMQPSLEANGSRSDPPAQEASDSTPIRRWQVEVEEASGIPDRIDLHGTLVVTVDGFGVADALLDHLNLPVIRISLDPGLETLVDEDDEMGRVLRIDPSDETMIADAIDLVDGPIAGLLHAASLDIGSEPWDATRPDDLTIAAHATFGLLRALDGRLRANPSIVASLTALDGRHGNHGSRFNALQAGASGVMKAFAHEIADHTCRVRAFDVHPDLLMEPESLAHRLWEDVTHLSGEVEVGLDRDGRRWALVAFAEDLEAESEDPNVHHWLVSGGGSGVTAASIIALAKAVPDAGHTFTLLGRSKLIPLTATWITWSDAELEEERLALRARLVEASKDGKVTMVQWNAAWKRMTRSRDVHATLAAIEATGNRASYEAVDINDHDAMVALGTSLEPVSGIIHGAGLEDSKRVTDKDWSMFDAVVRTKVDGWRNLISAAEQSGGTVLHACAFTSVAGRFGNMGQTDYAAANNILDAEMARLTASGQMRAVAIGWTGWKEVGMATRGSLESIFEAGGIDMLPLELGTDIFVEEILRNGRRRVLGCGSLGVMDRFDAFRAAPLRLPSDMAALIADPTRFPFVDRVLEIEEGLRLVTSCVLHPNQHRFLTDHAIDGVPYHPGVMAMEMFAQAALLLMPGTCLVGMEAVTFGLPVKLLSESMTVRIVAEVEGTEGANHRIRCHLESDITNSKGVTLPQPRRHHEAIVRLTSTEGPATEALLAGVERLPDVGIPLDGDPMHGPEFIYDRYFHGPRFQVHGGVIGPSGHPGAEGVDGIALMRHQLPEGDLFASGTPDEPVLLESLPMLVEACFQNAGLVAMEVASISSLPIGINGMEIIRVPEPDERLRVRTVQVDQDVDGVTVHDAIIVGTEEAPVLGLSGLRLKAMGVVPVDLTFTLERPK